MSSQQLRLAALGSVKNFRNREIQGLMRHLTKFGPLSEAVPSTSSTPATINLPNPFLPKKHSKTGHWHEAKYSLRRQADLVKKASLTGTLELLPPGPKKNAFQLRMDRLKEEKLLTKPLAKPHVMGTYVSKYNASIRDCDLSKPPLVSAFLEAKKKLRPLIAEYDGLAFDNLTDAEADIYLAKKRELDRQIEDLKYECYNYQSNIKDLDRIRAESLQKASPVEWDAVVGWAGEFKPRKVPGAHLGIRLYAGKKRMFKGHRWERLRLGVIKRRAMLVRDMKERVRNYKEYYKKRKPNPLKPSRYTKPPKLPF